MPRLATLPPKAVARGFETRLVDHAINTRRVVKMPSQKSRECQTSRNLTRHEVAGVARAARSSGPIPPRLACAPDVAPLFGGVALRRTSSASFSLLVSLRLPFCSRLDNERASFLSRWRTISNPRHVKVNAPSRPKASTPPPPLTPPPPPPPPRPPPPPPTAIPHRPAPPHLFR